MNEIYRKQLSNGLWLVGEPIAGMRSAALAMILPAGAAQEPEDEAGVAALLGELICRGAGELDAKAHCESLDHLGVQRDTTVMGQHMRLSAAMIGSMLPQAIPLLLDMVRHPQLAKGTLEPARDLAIQSIEALEDEPQEKVFLTLRQHHTPRPLNRSILGEREALERISIKQVRAFAKSTLVPGGSILAFAGDLDWNLLQDLVEKHLGDWQGERAEATALQNPERGSHHQQVQSSQVHMGLAFDAPGPLEEKSKYARAAVAVLSGGSSSRLFAEVRESRGLCYSVGARYGGDRRAGVISCYAGTTGEKAQETLDVLMREFIRLQEGISPEEFHRALVGMTSALVMQGESSSARAVSLASDQYLHGYPKSLAMLRAEVEAVTLAGLNQYVRENPVRIGARDSTLATIGPAALQWG